MRKQEKKIVNEIFKENYAKFSKKKSNSRSQSAIKLKLLPDCKRSQSQVIATVLLILLVIASVVIIMQFIIPFVKNQLSKTDCFNVINDVGIKDNPKYTCYDINGIMSVQIHFSENESLEGFAIELGGASSKTYEVKKGNNIVMRDGTNFELPGKNEERTYNLTISSKPDYIKVYPILSNGDVCDFSDVLTKIPLCS